jgi:hypothetical protein
LEITMRLLSLIGAIALSSASRPWCFSSGILNVAVTNPEPAPLT